MNKYEELFATNFPNPPYKEGEIIRWVSMNTDNNRIGLYQNPFGISEAMPINVGRVHKVRYNKYTGSPQESIYSYEVVWTTGSVQDKEEIRSITSNNIIGIGQGGIPDTPFVPQMSMRYIIDFGTVLKEFYAMLLGWHPTEKIWVYVVSDQHYLSKTSNVIPASALYRTAYDADQDPSVPDSKYKYQDHIQLPNLDNDRYYIVYQRAWNVGLRQWHYWLLPEDDWRNQRIADIPEEVYPRLVRVSQAHIDANRIV